MLELLQADASAGALIGLGHMDDAALACAVADLMRHEFSFPLTPVNVSARGVRVALSEQLPQAQRRVAALGFRGGLK